MAFSVIRTTRVDTAILAVKLLRQHGAVHLLHAGDIGGQRVIDALTGGPASFVWGNNDYDRDPLAVYARRLSVQCFDSFGEIELDGKQFAITHGDDSRLVKHILQTQAHDYLITGHSHIAHDRWQGDCRWINPGALHPRCDQNGGDSRHDEKHAADAEGQLIRP